MPLHPRPELLPHTSRNARHDHRVRSASSDLALIELLRSHKTDREGARRIVEASCAALAIPTPRVRTHARRAPDTGHARPPARITKDLAVDPERYPPEGHLQLSATPTLGVIAHELGHLVVFHTDPVGTPAHGLRWVSRFDEAALVVADVAGLRSPHGDH